jgi:dTMP kinase
VSCDTDTERRGAFITLEGIDGCGKTTQAALLADALERGGREVVRLREPGGTRISEKIRSILLDPENAEMADECELLLYEAARAQLVRQVIEPALERGAVVVCDRFYDSTYAYQAGGRALDEGLVDRCNELGCCGVHPTRTLVLDLEVGCALERATKDGTDRLEAEGVAFQERVRAGYLRLVEREADRVRLVGAAGSLPEVEARIAEALSDLFPFLLGTTSSGVVGHA